MLVFIIAVQTLNNIGLPKCLVCKLCLGSKTGYVVVTYRSPSQPYLEFQKFLAGLTHILFQSSSCIDLIFTDQPHLVTNCGTHASLHPNCDHHVTYYKQNLKITYPPPYKHLI